MVWSINSPESRRKNFFMFVFFGNKVLQFAHNHLLHILYLCYGYVSLGHTVCDFWHAKKIAILFWNYRIDVFSENCSYIFTIFGPYCTCLTMHKFGIIALWFKALKWIIAYNGFVYVIAIHFFVLSNHVKVITVFKSNLSTYTYFTNKYSGDNFINCLNYILSIN